jgi:hypothetical protein
MLYACQEVKMKLNFTGCAAVQILRHASINGFKSSKVCKIGTVKFQNREHD